MGPTGGRMGNVKGRPTHVSPLAGWAQGLVHQGQRPDCLQGLESCTLRETPAGPGRGGGGPLGYLRLRPEQNDQAPFSKLSALGTRSQ